MKGALLIMRKEQSFQRCASGASEADAACMLKFVTGVRERELTVRELGLTFTSIIEHEASGTVLR